MVLLAKLFLVLCIGLQYAASTPNSDYVYCREVDAWLRLHMVPATWSDAGMRCYLEGGVLASPTTNNLAQVMTALMAEHQLTRSVFTGINSILARENFTSLEGMPLSSIPLSWAAGEPDNANNDEDCVALTGAGKLADVSCDSVLPYFCRKESKCGSYSKGYEWEARTGSCYKFFRTSKTWLEALSICHKDGGHLAIINSYTESTVLKEIFEKNPRDTIVGALDPNYALIGFREWDDGKFATIQGTPLAEAGFERWSEGEPNNWCHFNNKTEDCGTIYRNGLLNDVPCMLPYPYICEITP